MSLENPHLSETHFLEKPDWKIDNIKHKDLCWVNGQVIRLEQHIFEWIENVLLQDLSAEIFLFNEANPINDFLLKKFEEPTITNFNWKVAKIIWKNEDWKWPILEEESLINVNISDMHNIEFWNISDYALAHSIPWYDKHSIISQSDLLDWLINNFYNKTKIRGDVIHKWLLLRKIQLINT